MEQIAVVQTEVLSDGSEVFNVVIPQQEQNARIVIGADSRESAEAIADAINNGASWVQA